MKCNCESFERNINMCENKIKHDFIKKWLLLNASPPIKEPITKGKLKWRGIKYAECRSTKEFWILQRGKQISPKLKIIRRIINV